MAIRPIDMQTNISQIHEVGKGEQARTEAVVEQQHVLEKESGEKSRLVNTKLDEARKGESATIKDHQKKEREGTPPHPKQAGSSGKRKRKESIDDDRMGQIIDILK